MRPFWAGVLGLALLTPGLRADDPAKKPAERFVELSRGFDKEMGELQQKFATAPRAEKAKFQDRALKLIAETAEKMMALAKQNPKDPAAVDALVWAALQGRQSPQSQELAHEAAEKLVKEHLGSDRIGPFCMILRGHPDAEKLLRQVHEQNPGKAAKLYAASVLAELLRDRDDESAAANKEIEKLLVEVTERGKAEGLPPFILRPAEAALFEVRNLAVGKKAPPAQGTTLEGKAVKLSDYQGKVVVLDFWATWCPPCRAMIPHEREMVKKHAGKPFVFVSISADDEKDDLTKFLEKEPMPWVHWFNGRQGGIIEQWNIQAFPTMYVLDGQGVIRGKIVGGGPDNEKKLGELVEKLLKQ